MNRNAPLPKIPIEAALESARLGTWTCDGEGRLLVSPGFVAGCGVDAELSDCAVADWIAAAHPEDRERVRDFLAAAARSGDSLLWCEFRLRSGNGDWIWVHMRGRVVERDAKGRLRVSAGTLADVSERKQAEILLQIQHDFSGLLLGDPDRPRLFEAILAAALQLPSLDSGGLYVGLPDGGFRLTVHRGLSPAFIDQVGHLPVDSPLTAIIRLGELQCSCSEPCPQCTGIDLLSRPHIAAEGLRALIVLPIMADGQAVACLNLASHTHGTTPAATITGLETLTRQFAQALARIQASEQAAHRRENLDGLFGAISDYLFVLDMDGTVRHYNRAVAEGLGYGRTLLGRPVADIHPPESREEVARIVGEMIAGKRDNCPIPLLRADGTRLDVDTRVVAGQWDGKPAIIGVSRDVTEQLRQEKSLGEARQFSEDLINALPGIYFLIDQGGRMVRWNHRLCEVTGRDDAEIGAMKAIDFFGGDDVEHIRASVAEAFVKGDASAEGVLLDRSGKGRPHLFSARRTVVGGRDYIAGFGVDVGAMKEAEQNLAEAAERRRALFEQSKDGIAVADLHGRVVEANATFAGMLGYSLDELSRMNVADWETRSLDEMSKEFASFESGSRTFETRHRRKDGSVYDVEVSVSAIHWQGETLLLGVHRDIGRRKAAEASLREREAIYGAIVDRSLEGLLLVDVETMRFVEFNDAACDGLGYSREEFAKLTLPDVQGTLTPEETRTKVDDAVNHPDGIRFENKHRCRDGSLRDRYVSNRPVVVGGRTCLAHVWHDITDEKLAERRLQEATMFLRETQGIARMGGWKANPETDMLLWTEEVYRLVEHPLDTPPAGLADGLKYYAPEFMPEIKRLLEAAWQHGTPFTMETEMIAASGRRFWAELRCVGRIQSDEGAFLTGTFQDITKRRRVEEALRASEKRYRAIVENQPDAVCRWLPDTTLTYANALYSEIFAPGQGDLTGRRWIDFVPPDARGDVLATYADLAAHPSTLTYDHRVLRENGSERWYQWVDVPLLDGDGRCVEFQSVGRDITERKELEQNLRASEKRYRSVFDTLGEGIVLVSDQGVMLACNPAAERILGKPAAEMIGTPALSHTGDPLREDGTPFAYDDLPMVQGIRNGTAQRDVIMDIARADGRRVWVRLNVEPTFSGDGGKPIAEVVSFADITEQKHAEAEVERYRGHLEELVTERTAALEAANRRLSTNDRRLSAMLEISQQAVQLDERQVLARALEVAVALSGSEIGYLHLVNPDQETVAFHLWSEGALRYCTALSDPHYAVSQAGLWADAVRLRRPVIHNDYQALEKRKGYPSGHAHVVRHLAVPIMDGGRVTMLLGVGNKASDYTQWDIAELQLIGNDITSIAMRRRAEVGLAGAKAAAEAASVAKSAFLANMSHEIRTPMNGIIGMANLLRRSGVTPGQAEQLDKIDTAADHLLGIINDILDISKIEAGKFMLDEGPLSVEAVLSNVTAILSERARVKGIGMRVELDPVPAHLVGDATRLQQALLNYANNAIKFTERGTVTLRVRLVEESSDAVAVRFEVTDTGVGVPADAIGRLFNAFEQADSSTTRKYGGTGLGLAITRRLAEMMGGTAGAESHLGQGSTFWFTARLHKSTAAPVSVGTESHADAEAQLRSRFAGERVLVVDDEPINCEVAKMLLEDAGLVVDTAEDGLQAVAMAGTTPYAAILMDMRMPNLDGLGATHQIRKASASLDAPIIAMTANAFAEDKARCIDAGMDDFLAKPFEPEALFATLLQWLSRVR